MATGIPRTKWQSAPHLPRGNGKAVGNTDVHLSYEGKQAEREILKTPPAHCRQLWPERGHQSEPNRLYYGDNLPILAALAHDPTVCGKVRLVYIDPPYATKSVFQSRNQNDAYMDLLEGAHYLEFLRERLILLRELLADDGSIYVHLDDNMAFLVKAIMDEVFGSANFRNWITRKKCNPKNYTRKTYGNVSDYILFYTKSESYVWHRPVESWTEERADKEYQYTEPGTGRRYKKVPVHAPGVFKKHGMEIVGFWVPTDKDKGADSTLIYLLAHKSREEAKKSWAAFVNDPEWKKARDESEAAGKLVDKAESVFLSATDYSPMK